MAFRRGFLLESNRKSKVASKPAVNGDPKSPSFIKIPSANVVLYYDDIPQCGDLQTLHEERQLSVTITTIPFNELPYTVCCLMPGVKEKIYAHPTFGAPFSRLFSKPYRIAQSDGAGYGVFATKDLRPGDLVMCERPLLIMPIAMPTSKEDPGAFQRLLDLAINGVMSPEMRAAFLKLKNCKASETLHVKGILDTNALYAGALPGWNAAHLGVCDEISRMNHSCSPNVTCRFDLDSFTFRVYAVRPIPSGSEVLFTYTNLLSPCSDRQSELWQKYTFKCVCRVCSLCAVESRRSDDQRALLVTQMTREVGEDDGMIKWLGDKSLPDDYIISRSRRFIDLMDEEGVFHEKVWPRHFQIIVKAYCAIKDRENAVRYAKRALELQMAFTGSYGGWDKVVENPEGTDWWGRRS